MDELTPVLFRKYDGEVTAVFPTHDEGSGLVSCYAHIGQHSACSRGWYVQTKEATPAEYADLKAELEGAPYRYRLKIMRRWYR